MENKSPTPNWVSPFFNNEKLSEGTRATYKLDFEYFFRYLSKLLNTETLSPNHFDDFSEMDLINYLNHLKKDKGNGRVTRRRKLSEIKAFYDFFLYEGILHKNPTRDLKINYRPEKTDYNPETLLQKLETRVCYQGDRTKLRDKAIILLLLTGKLKTNDIVDLRIEDYNKDLSILFLSEKDFISLPPNTDNALKNYLEDEINGRNRFEPKDDTLFLAGKGSKLNRYSIRSILQKYDDSISVNTLRKVVKQNEKEKMRCRNLRIHKFDR